MLFYFNDLRPVLAINFHLSHPGGDLLDKPVGRLYVTSPGVVAVFGGVCGKHVGYSLVLWFCVGDCLLCWFYLAQRSFGKFCFHHSLRFYHHEITGFFRLAGNCKVSCFSGLERHRVRLQFKVQP